MASTTFSTTTTTYNNTTTTTTTSVPGGNNDDDNPGVAGDITPAIFALFAVFYVVVMLVSRRQRLYHVWNHLTVIMFAVHCFTILFTIAFNAAHTTHVSCRFASTMLSACHNTATISMFLMFCVMMVPVCFEPERKKIFLFEMILFGGMFLWIVLQVGLFAGTAKFTHGDNPRLCHLLPSETVLAALFDWVPSFLNVLFSGYFIYWVRTRNSMLNRRRIYVFAYILMLSNVVKAVGCIVHIHNSVEHAKHFDRHGLSSGMIVFVTTLVYSLHIIVLAIAFSYAEDLVPARIRHWCACCCGDSGESFDDPFIIDQCGSLDEPATTATGAATTTAVPPQIAGPGKGEDNNNNNNNTEQQQQQQQQQQQSGGGGGGYGTAAASSSSSPSSARASSRHSVTTNNANQLQQQRQALLENFTVTHTLTYFLQMNRDDIICQNERNIVESSIVNNIRASFFGNSSEAGGGIASRMDRPSPGGMSADRRNADDGSSPQTSDGSAVWRTQQQQQQAGGGGEYISSKSSAQFHASVPYFPPHDK